MTERMGDELLQLSVMEGQGEFTQEFGNGLPFVEERDNDGEGNQK